MVSVSESSGGELMFAGKVTKFADNNVFSHLLEFLLAVRSLCPVWVCYLFFFFLFNNCFCGFFFSHCWLKRNLAD